MPEEIRIDLGAFAPRLLTDDEHEKIDACDNRAEGWGECDREPAVHFEQGDESWVFCLECAFLMVASYAVKKAIEQVAEAGK